MLIKPIPLVLLLGLAAGALPAQTAPGGSAARADSAAAAAPGILSSAGATRAGTAVGQVYVDRVTPELKVEGGDFASHLLERLGVRPVPDGLEVRVAVDQRAVTLTSRVRDLPPQVREMLGPSLNFVSPDAVIAGDVGLTVDGPGVVRFRLRGITLDGMTVPEMILGPMLAEVGRRVPALTKTGRDLLVAIPPKAALELVSGGVRLVGPPDAAATPR